MYEELFGGKLEVTIVPDSLRSLSRGGRRTAWTEKSHYVQGVVAGGETKCPDKWGCEIPINECPDKWGFTVNPRGTS